MTYFNTLVAAVDVPPTIGWHARLPVSSQNSSQCHRKHHPVHLGKRICFELFHIQSLFLSQEEKNTDVYQSLKYTFLRHFKISSFTVTHEHCSLSNACIPYPFKVYKLALHEIQVTHTGTLSLLLWTFFIWGKKQQDLEQSASLWQRKACAAGRSEARLGGFESRASSNQTLNLQADLRSPSDVTALYGHPFPPQNVLLPPSL